MRDNRQATEAELTRLIREATGMDAERDAALLNLWRQYQENEATQYPEDVGSPDYDARYDAVATAYSDTWNNICSEIAETPAASLEGLRVKFMLAITIMERSATSWSEDLIDVMLADFDRLTGAQP